MMQDRVIDVFISYSSKDKAIADAVCNRLESGNLRCWYAPRDILPGADWATSVVHAIQRSRVFLLIYSENTNHSKHVFNELTMAFNSNCAIIPFRMDDSVMNSNIAFYLSAVHWLDALTPPLENHIEHLYRYVQSVLQGTLPPPPPDPPKKNTGKRIIKGIALILACLLMVTAGIFGTIFLVEKIQRDKQSKDIGANVQLPIEDQVSEETHEATTTETTEPTAETGESLEDTEMTEQPEPAIQEILCQPFNDVNGYSYPGYKRELFCADFDCIILENDRDNCMNLVDICTGNILVSGIEHDFATLHLVCSFITPDFKTVYFFDQYEKRVCVYDIREQCWKNQAGYPVTMGENEIYKAVYQVGYSLYSSNDDVGSACMFLRDVEEECFSQLVWITPDGIRETIDIRSLGLTGIISGFTSNSRYDKQILMFNKNRNLQVLDLASGQILDLDFNTILRDYIPKLESGGSVLSENGQYLLLEDGTQFTVWDVQNDSSVLHKTFPDSYFNVQFVSEHEIGYYTLRDCTLHIYDLQNHRETVLLSKEYFAENSAYFYDLVFPNYVYSDEFDMFFFVSTASEYDSDIPMRLTAIDREGNICAVGENMMMPDGKYAPSVYMYDDYILVQAYRKEYPTDDLPLTVIYRALYTGDATTGIEFADVYLYD